MVNRERELWLVPNQHCHISMQAGENTLNAHNLEGVFGQLAHGHIIQREIEPLLAAVAG